MTLTAGCDAVPDPADDPPSDSAPADPASGRAASPLDNPDGTAPGLAPLTSAPDREAALRVIDRLATRGRGPGTGYDRDEFGYAWMDTADGVPLAGNGCDTRNDLLRRDGRAIRLRSGDDCVVGAMELADPYAGRDIDFERGPSSSMEVQIDHVVPLSYAWRMGAARWPEDEREKFANDPLNLLAVDGDANAAKGDSGPAAWLPPNRRVRCAYGVRFAQVALKYELPVTAADKDAMRSRCRS